MIGKKEGKKEGKKRRKERRKERKKEGKKKGKKKDKKVVGKKIGTEEKIETPSLCRKFFPIYETEITIRSTLVRASSNGKFLFRMCCF